MKIRSNENYSILKMEIIIKKNLHLIENSVKGTFCHI